MSEILKSECNEIAYIGLGIMGSSMAIHLKKSGNIVRAWNRSNKPELDRVREAGVLIEPTVQACVAQAKYIFVCVSDVPDVEEVILGAQGIAAFAREDSIVIDTSTIGPAAARRISQGLAKKNLRFLDAPVTGGDVGARNATLTVLVGGSREDFDEAEPLLSLIGKDINYCGPVGSGQALKLCNQILCAVNMVAVTESLRLAQALDLDGALVVDALKSGAGGSWALSTLGPRILQEDFKPGFMIKDMLKDLRLVTENLEGAASVALPGMRLAEAQFEVAKKSEEDGGRKLGTQAMIRAYS